MRSESAIAAIPLNRPLYLFYGSGIVIVGGGFVLYTSGADLSVAGDATAGSPLSQSILGFYYLLAALLFVSARGFVRVLKGSWPVLILPCLAVISAAWSPDPALTLRRAFAFCGTVLFGLSLASAYDYRDCSALICKALVAAMVLSVSVVLVDPRYGVHQTYDAVQAVHAGAWRGIFAHRNTLGLWAGITLAILAVAGRDAFGIAGWMTALWATIACLFYSGSSAGIVIAAFFILCHLILMFIVGQPSALRVPAALIVLALAIAIALFWNDLTGSLLEILGRGRDLSGRVYIWYYLIQANESFDRPLGLGYFVGTLMLDDLITSSGQWQFVNAHNGYLEAFISFGYFGLIAAIFAILWIAGKSIVYLFNWYDKAGEVRTLPVLCILTIASHNVVESTLVSPNNLNSLLLAASAGLVAVTRFTRA